VATAALTENLLAGSLITPIEGIDNGFVGGYRVRFDEAGPDGRLRTAGLLRYAQDVAWRHSEALGFDRRWYEEQDLSWVVRAVDLEVTGPIQMGQVVRAETVVIEVRRAWARRRGEFRLADGTSVAIAYTDWVIVDGRGRLVRIPEVFSQYFPSRAAEGSLTRVSPPPAPEDAERLELRVRPPDIDPMGHVNNGVYLDWFEEAVAAAGDPELTTSLPRRIKLEYAASAEPGDVLDALSWRADGGWWQRLVRPRDGVELARARIEGLR
jgi:acyl-ACP thioesterase